MTFLELFFYVTWILKISLTPEDSSSIPDSTENFSPFLVISSDGEMPLSALSPFIIEKTLAGLTETAKSNARKFCSNSGLFIEWMAMVKMRSCLVFRFDVSCESGVIRCTDHAGMSDIASARSDHHVSKVKRKSSLRDGKGRLKLDIAIF